MGYPRMHDISGARTFASITPSDQGLFWNVKASDPGLDAKSSRSPLVLW